MIAGEEPNEVVADGGYGIASTCEFLSRSGIAAVRQRGTWTRRSALMDRICRESLYSRGSDRPSFSDAFHCLERKEDCSSVERIWDLGGCVFALDSAGSPRCIAQDERLTSEYIILKYHQSKSQGVRS